MADNYRAGDHYILDDITGQRIRASEARQQWDGLVTHRRNWSPRHPQDFVRSVGPDKQVVPDSRPRPVYESFIGPLTTTVTTAASAGATSIAVDSSVRMEPQDSVSIMLANGAVHSTRIVSIPDATHITIEHPLPAAIEADTAVIDNSAMAEPTLG